MKNCKIHNEDDGCELPSIPETLIGNTHSAVNSEPCLYPHGKYTSDGYHTFDELYHHRIALFIALCSYISSYASVHGHPTSSVRDVWRSKLHNDGTMFDGWFIMGIGTEKYIQISYHLPISEWERTDFAETLEKAPEWDGHTPADVLDRLKLL